MTDDILAAAIEREVQTRDYYDRVSKKIGNEKVKKRIARLARDEQRHIEILSDRYRKLFDRDYAPVAMDADPVFDVADEDPAVIDTALKIVSVAIGFEIEAIEVYTGYLNAADDAEEQKMLNKLIRFEQGHKKKLQHEHKRLSKGFSWVAG